MDMRNEMERRQAEIELQMQQSQAQFKQQMVAYIKYKFMVNLVIQQIMF